MNQRKAKLIRSIFKDRTTYRQYKKAYTQATLPKKLEATRTLQQMAGKKVYIEESSQS